MNNVYFPAIKRFDGDIESNFEMLINPRLEDHIARRIELSDLLTYIEDNVSFTADNIYNTDGVLDGNRLLTGDAFSYNIQFADLSGFTASVGDNANYSAYINIENTPSVTLYAEDADTGHNISLTIGPDTALFAAGANSNYLHIHQDTVELSSAGSLKLLTPGVNAATASVGQFLRLANANGTVEFATVSSANIYNADGTLTGHRILSGGSVYNLTFTNLSNAVVTSLNDITLTATAGEAEVTGLTSKLTSTGTGLLEGTTVTGNKVFINPITDLIIDTGDASLANGLKVLLYSVQAGTARKGCVLTLLDETTGMTEWIGPESDYTTLNSSSPVDPDSAIYGVNASGGAIITSLPTAAGNRNVVMTFIKTDATANTVTIDALGIETINGAGNYVLSSQYDFVKIISDNINWIVIGSGIATNYTELAQDAVGAMVNSTLTYTDGTPELGINLSNANTWLADQSVPDEAYGVGWNGSVEVPTKNALYDKIEQLQPLDATLTALAGITTAADKIIQITGSDTFTTQDFKIATEATYSGSITWSGTSAPSGSTNHSYKWTRIGNMVVLTITLVYGSAGSAVTTVQMDLPNDCPAPDEPDSLNSASEFLYVGTGYLATSTTANPATSTAFMKINSGDTGYELVVRGASGNYALAAITITYFTA